MVCQIQGKAIDKIQKDRNLDGMVLFLKCLTHSIQKQDLDSVKSHCNPQRKNPGRKIKRRTNQDQNLEQSLHLNN